MSRVGALLVGRTTYGGVRFSGVGAIDPAQDGPRVRELVGRFADGFDVRGPDARVLLDESGSQRVEFAQGAVGDVGGVGRAGGS